MLSLLFLWRRNRIDKIIDKLVERFEREVNIDGLSSGLAVLGAVSAEEKRAVWLSRQQDFIELRVCAGSVGRG